MVKHGVLIVAVLFYAAMAHSGNYQTLGTGTTYTLADLVTISGGTVTGGPTLFSLNGNLTISQTDTLVVNPGQQLSAANDPGGIGYVVRIAGTLTAQGTSGQPIVFTAASEQPGAWRGIYMTPTCIGSVVQYAQIKYALTGIHCAGCAPVIDNNTFSGCRDVGIYCCRGASPTIMSNTFLNNSQAIGFVLDASVPTTCTQNVASHNLAGMSVASTGGTPVVGGNSALENRDIGIYCPSAVGAIIEDNIVERNAFGIMVARASNSQFARNQVRQNIFEGISVANEATSTFRNTLVEDNSTTIGGVVVYDTAAPDFGLSTADGLNQFQNNHYYDYVNFTENTQYAIGNTWSAPGGIDYLIYDRQEDAGDADGSGFLSGYVIHSWPLQAGTWWLYN